MKIRRQTKVDRGIKIEEDQVPYGWEVVHRCYPHTTPWDYCGEKFLKEYGKVLKAAGIPYVSLRTRETNMSPMPSGPNGTVRFGDAMMPGNYRVAVPKAYQPDANYAINQHREAIGKWLHENGPQPEACKG